jgi:hypothetical protein
MKIVVLWFVESFAYINVLSDYNKWLGKTTHDLCVFVKY